MVDPRIMVAVLASMLLTATGLETGVDPGDVTGRLPEIGDIGGQFNREAGPASNERYELSADISLERDSAQHLQTRSAEVELGPSTISMSSGNLTANSSIVLANFSGRISTGQLIELSGETDGWSTESASFSGLQEIVSKVDSRRFSVETGFQEDVTLSNVTGILVVNGTETRLENRRNLSVDAFNGSIDFFSQNSTIVLEGSADGTRAGSLTYR